MNLEAGKLRLATTAVIVCTAIGATWALAFTINSAKNDMNRSVSTLTNQIQALTTSLDDVKANSYTLSRASEQALRTAIENPTLRVPDPRDPSKIIVVFSAKTGNTVNSLEK